MAGLGADQKYLLDHYLHRTGKMASAHVGNYTPFTDSLLPITHVSEMLLESILTFSSYHLAATGMDSSPVKTLEHQALALRNVKYSLTRYAGGDIEVGVQLFLSMLMLCCVEVCPNPPFPVISSDLTLINLEACEWRP